MIKTIIYDFDGTLGDSQQLIVGTIRQTLDNLYLEPRSIEQCTAVIGLPLKAMFMKLLPMTDDMGTLCAQTYRHIFDQRNVSGAVKPFPHVVETIHALRDRGFCQTIASSRGRETLLRYIEEMDLSSSISYIVSVDDVQHAKPAPDMVLKTLDFLHVLPKETLVVGDTPFDIRMGKAANVQTVGVTYGNGTRTKLKESGADYIIDCFEQLLPIVSRGEEMAV